MKPAKILIQMTLCSGLFFLFSCRGNTKKEKTDDVSEPVVTIKEMEPDDDFDQALNAFADQDHEKSSKFILKAAKSMEPIAALAPGKYKELIETSISELNDLAEQVATDHVDGIDDLNYFFGRAGNALAGYRIDVTETYFNSHSPKQTGEALKSAINRLEADIKYYNREITSEEKRALEEAKVLTARLEKGEKIGDEEIKKNLNDLKVQLKKWDDEFGTKKNRP